MTGWDREENSKISPTLTERFNESEDVIHQSQEEGAYEPGKSQMIVAKEKRRQEERKIFSQPW